MVPMMLASPMPETKLVENAENAERQKMDASVGFEIVSSRRLVGESGTSTSSTCLVEKSALRVAFRSGASGFEQCTPVGAIELDGAAFSLRRR